MYPSELRYHKEHEWVKVEPDGTALVGITIFAQEQLGDVVYVDLPPSGTKVAQFAKLGEIESVKAVSELYSPIGGEVVAVNLDLKAKPELVNQDPYKGGWLVRLKVKDSKEVMNLMDSKEYEKMLAGLK